MSPDPVSRARAVRLDASVRGSVQGVGFRFFVVRVANGLGLTGWVANVPDGSVRCVAEGPPEAIARFETLLQDGPPEARVERVLASHEPALGRFVGFSIRSGGHSGD